MHRSSADNRYQPIIGRFADNRYRLIIVYTLGKYKFYYIVVRSTGGDWSVIDHTAQPLPMPPRMCPSSMLNYTVSTAGFCPVSGTFCINR